MKCVCDKCGWKWESRKKDELPRECPRCKSYRWNQSEERKEAEKSVEK